MLSTIFFAMDNYLRISGYVKLSMFINVLSNIFTVGLLAFFLLVCDMDVVGSALATSISMCGCSIVAMIPFIRKKALLKFAKPQFNRKMFKEIAACGSPIFLNNISGRITSVFINIALMTLGVQVLGTGGGTTAVAVYAVMMYASDLCWPLLYGISDSLSPALGYNWGAGHYDRVKKIVKCAYIGTAVVGLLSTSLLFFAPDMIASWFANENDARLLKVATDAIRLFSLAYLFRWFVVTTQGFLSAIGKAMQAAIMSVATAFVFPMLLLGGLWMLKLEGVWLNFVGVNLFGSILGLILLSMVFKEIKMIEVSGIKKYLV